ncbi:hypothetical protein Tco_1393982 [Tanacetum coccineum]
MPIERHLAYRTMRHGFHQPSSLEYVSSHDWKPPLVHSFVDDKRYVVPTGRVKVPAGRYVVPTGKDNVIVSTGRTKVIPAGRTILVLVVLCLLRVDSKVS